MRRYIWKRDGWFPYSGHPMLNHWIPIEQVDETNTFASETDAYVAYGRYAHKIVRDNGDHGFGAVDRFRWMDLRLVAVESPDPTPPIWKEVTA